MTKTTWLLPEGIDEFLPPQAWALEKLRRKILNHFWCCGYDLVHPPQIEYLESLLVGTGHDFDLQTFKLVDQLGGRTLGFRADMTPQVARIDAHRLKKTHPVRLCYLGTVLRTLPDGLSGGRNPLQLGAELYGHTGVESDAEILGLMIETLQIAGIKNLYLDIGHVGLFRGLAKQADLSAEQTIALFDMLQRKARADTENYLESIDCKSELVNAFSALIELNGDASVLDTADTLYSGTDAQVREAIAYLRALAKILHDRFPDTQLHFDLAELRGYHYHTGVVFAAYQHGQGQEIARGGRYDEIGRAFGRARPATGFSTDLKALLTGDSGAKEDGGGAIYANWPALHDEWSVVQKLRAEGKRVVCDLPGQAGDARELGCTQTLEINNENWQIKGVE